ncbi:MAG: HNH endonuclease [Kiritimatiellia bacterium]
MVRDYSYWLHKLATLKIDHSRGDPAPHKPFLLLVILEMADAGEITGSELPLSPDLAFRFSMFNSVIADRKRAPLELNLPFHHLKTSGIWQPLMADGQPSPHRSLTTKVQFDSAFLACLSDPAFREKAKRVLIATPPYFRPEEQGAIYEMLGLKSDHDGLGAEPIGLCSVPVERGREARFRVEVVVVAYRHTCALTGCRMTTLSMESLVDAAHIHEFRNSRNNDPRNGLALSKNAHWQFDRGLWSVTDDYQILVNCDKFVEAGPAGQKLADFAGRRLFLPMDQKYWPEPKHLSWHRENKYAV